MTVTEQVHVHVQCLLCLKVVAEWKYVTALIVKREAILNELESFEQHASFPGRLLNKGLFSDVDYLLSPTPHGVKGTLSDADVSMFVVCQPSPAQIYGRIAVWRSGCSGYTALWRATR